MEKELTSAQKLRAELKAAGYNSRKVSVKSINSTIKIVVKDIEADFVAISNIATAYQKVDYCEASGEVLEGGNTFVNVDYSDEAKAQIFDLREDQLTDCNNINGVKIYVFGKNEIRIKKDNLDWVTCRSSRHATIALHKYLMNKPVKKEMSLDRARQLTSYYHNSPVKKLNPKEYAEMKEACRIIDRQFS